MKEGAVFFFLKKKNLTIGTFETISSCTHPSLFFFISWLWARGLVTTRLTRSFLYTVYSISEKFFFLIS